MQVPLCCNYLHESIWFFEPITPNNSLAMQSQGKNKQTFALTSYFGTMLMQTEEHYCCLSIYFSEEMYLQQDLFSFACTNDIKIAMKQFQKYIPGGIFDFPDFRISFSLQELRVFLEAEGALNGSLEWQQLQPMQGSFIDSATRLPKQLIGILRPLHFIS